MSALNRRTALTAVAVLPALAVPTVIAALPGSNIEAAAEAVESCWRELGHSCDVLGIAEKKHYAWKAANPRPKAPPFPPMDLKETLGDMVMRMRELSSEQFPKAGEQQEYEQRAAAWDLRSEAVEDETGVTAAEALEGAASNALHCAMDGLVATPARTLEELRCKARVSHLTEFCNAERPIAASIVRDLLAL